MLSTSIFLNRCFISSLFILGACTTSHNSNSDMGKLDAISADLQSYDTNLSNENCAKLSATWSSEGIQYDEGLLIAGGDQAKSFGIPLDVTVKEIDKCSFLMEGKDVSFRGYCYTNKIDKLPFKVGDVLDAIYCEDASGALTMPIFVSFRRKNGELLLAGNVGSKLSHVNCLPPEIKIDIADSNCPTMSQSSPSPDDCGRKRKNYGLKFQMNTNSVELWTGDSSTFTLNGTAYAVENFYSYFTEGTPTCTDYLNPRESWLVYKK